jgi:hypothetical protein
MSRRFTAREYGPAGDFEHVVAEDGDEVFLDEPDAPQAQEHEGDEMTSAIIDYVGFGFPDARGHKDSMTTRAAALLAWSGRMTTRQAAEAAKISVSAVQKGVARLRQRLTKSASQQK